MVADLVKSQSKVIDRFAAMCSKCDARRVVETNMGVCHPGFPNKKKSRIAPPERQTRF
jgi:hypothetical protein